MNLILEIGISLKFLDSRKGIKLFDWVNPVCLSNKLKLQPNIQLAELFKKKFERKQRTTDIFTI
jgi:hypothetical protein